MVAPLGAGPVNVAAGATLIEISNVRLHAMDEVRGTLCTTQICFHDLG